MTRNLNLFLSFLTGSVLILGPGCGYNLRGNTRPFFESHNIHTLYVAPVKNNSYKAGIEITVYNALRKRFAQGGYVRLVDSPLDAESQINATVQDALYAPQAITTADQIASVAPRKGPATYLVATSYGVTLKVDFKLVDRFKNVLWMQSLARAKSFQATTGLGTLGSTTALINESEFERALSDLSGAIVVDAEESINTIF